MALRFMVKPHPDNMQKRRAHSRMPMMNVSGFPFLEAFETAQKHNRILLPNKKVGELLLAEGKPLLALGTHARWVGTMTAYEEPGKGFGKFVEYTDALDKKTWVFPVPRKFQGMKDTILVVEHPNYDLVSIRDGAEVLVRAHTPCNHIVPLPGFPQKSGSYMGDEIHGIPFGEEYIKGSPEAMNLIRLLRARVGPIARGPEIINTDGPRNVVISFSPSLPLGMIVESACASTMACPC